MRRNTNRQVDHEQLVAAASSLALDDGLHAVTHEALAARCGAQPKAVQQLHPDLAPIVAETFGRIAGAELAEVKRLVLAHPSPVRQLQVLLEALAEPVRAEVDAVWLDAWSLGHRNAVLGAAVREQEGARHALVAAVVRRGVRGGQFLPVDADDVAAQILAMIDGVNAYALVGYRSDLDRMRLLTAIARAELGAGIDEPQTQAQVYAQIEARIEAGAEEDAETRAVAWAETELDPPTEADIEQRAVAVGWADGELEAPGEAAAELEAEAPPSVDRGQQTAPEVPVRVEARRQAGAEAEQEQEPEPV